MDKLKLVINIKDSEHTLDMDEVKELYEALDQIFGEKEKTVERVIHEYPWGRWWPYYTWNGNGTGSVEKLTWTSGTGNISMSTIKN